jgi:nitric oxide synthase oxygenase domain/subunit
MANNDTDLQWAAGVISTFGSFFVVNTSGNAPAAVRFVARTSRYPETMKRLADIMGVNVSYVTQAGKEATQVVLQGEVLHRFMRLVWDHLQRERQYEYAEARREARNRKVA